MTQQGVSEAEILRRQILRPVAWCLSGKQSKDGKYYDRNGAYDGKKSKDGKYYINYGAYQGKGAVTPPEIVFRG